MKKSIIWKRNLQKWWHRVELTKRIRFNFKTMKINYKYRMKRAVWDAFWERRRRTRKLVQSLCNLEREYKDYQTVNGFRVLKSYNQSKKYTSKKLKKISLDNIESMLTQRNIIILTRYFRRYKAITINKNHKATHCKKIILNMMNSNLRWGFNAWRHVNRKMMDS